MTKTVHHIAFAALPILGFASAGLGLTTRLGSDGAALVGTMALATGLAGAWAYGLSTLRTRRTAFRAIPVRHTDRRMRPDQNQSDRDNSY